MQRLSSLARVLVLLVVANVLLLVAGEILFASKAARTGSSLRIGLVFDVGGLGDKSFNDLAYIGLQRAVRELGVESQYLEPAEGTDREAGLRQFASQGYDLVIGVGFIFSADMFQLAKDFPNTKFACVDYAPQQDATGNVLAMPSNLIGLKFREEEGSFLVGAIAGLVSKSKTVGFVGGMTIPLIRKFEAGYAAGVKAACPTCSVVVNYAGSDPNAFKNPSKGKEHSLAQHAKGADVIFHASGSTGLGVFEAAREKGFLAIGVDADQYDEMPGTVLTSMVKGIDVAVYDTIVRVAEKRFESGLQNFGLAENGVGYVYNEHNKQQTGKDAALYLSPNLIKKVEALKAEIVAGSRSVPTEP